MRIPPWSLPHAFWQTGQDTSGLQGGDMELPQGAEPTLEAAGSLAR